MKKVFLLLSFVIQLSFFATAQKDRDSIIKVFHTLIKLNDNFLESQKKNDSAIAIKERQILETYSENYYDPILPTFVDLTCKTKDSDLFQEFLKVLVSSQNSANEEPYYHFAQIYLRQPDFTLNSIDKFKERDLALNFLNDGLQVFPITEKKQIQNYQLLEDRLHTKMKTMR
jgi:hypothetical protein